MASGVEWLLLSEKELNDGEGGGWCIAVIGGAGDTLASDDEDDEGEGDIKTLLDGVSLCSFKRSSHLSSVLWWWLFDK